MFIYMDCLKQPHSISRSATSTIAKWHFGEADILANLTFFHAAI